MNKPIIDRCTGVELRACTGCGHLNIDVIRPSFLGCCPDSNYIPIREYLSRLEKENFDLRIRVFEYEIK